MATFHGQWDFEVRRDFEEIWYHIMHTSIGVGFDLESFSWKSPAPIVVISGARESCIKVDNKHISAIKL